MALSQHTPPASEPLTVTEAKDHLRLGDTTAEDDLISALISVAREKAEAYTHRAFITQTWDLVLDKAPCDATKPLEIPLGRLQSVTSVSYLDTSSVNQTWDPAKYTVDVTSDPGRIKPLYGLIWPVVLPDINVFTVRFITGYGDATAVPAAIKQAMLLTLGHFYENREDSVLNLRNAVELPMGSKYLLDQYKLRFF